MPRAAEPFPYVFVATPAKAARISRELEAGRLRRLAPRLYTTDVALAPERVMKARLWEIASLLFPGAVVTDRTAFEAGPAADGSVFLAADRARDVVLPGAILRVRKGAGPVAGDTPFLGLHLASRARAYLENMRPSRARSGVARRLSRRELEEKLEAALRDKGEEHLQAIRDEAREIAPALGFEAEARDLDAIIGALLGTREARLRSPTGRARARGEPYDARRVELFLGLHHDLFLLSPVHRPDPVRDVEERYLPFFEAYFSNFIEGTEFEVEEAARIVFEGRIPSERPEDAHDVLGTFRVVSDREEMARAPATFEELLSLLRARHARVMEGRPDKAPGAFKTVPNRAGDTVFVEPELVAATLARGFDLHRTLPDAFQRAVFMMFLVSEVHPFVDGNGRVARIMMNAELVAAKERRIVVPTIFRSSYLSGLREASQGTATRTLIRALDFLQRYTLAIDITTFEGARAELEATHAFRDPQAADAEGVRLMLPG